MHDECRHGQAPLIENKIYWQNPNSDVLHTIPEGAVVIFKKPDGTRMEIWNAPGGEICWTKPHGKGEISKLGNAK